MAVVGPSTPFAALVDPPLGESMFGIDSSVLLAALLGLFALGVILTVASGHRGERRTH